MKSNPRQYLMIALLVGLSLIAASCGGSEAGETAGRSRPAPAQETAEATAPEGDAPADEDVTADEGENDSAEQTGAGAAHITVVATDFEFNLPATLPAAKTRFTLMNNGKHRHAVAIALLAEGAPPMRKLVKIGDEKAETYLETEPMFTWADPGEIAEDQLVLNLKPGRRYAYACFLETNGKSHAKRGQVGEFRVE